MAFGESGVASGLFVLIRTTCSCLLKHAILQLLSSLSSTTEVFFFFYQIESILIICGV